MFSKADFRSQLGQVISFRVGASRAAKSTPRAAKSGEECPKSAQERPKSGPRAAKGSPRRPESGPRASKISNKQVFFSLVLALFFFTSKQICFNNEMKGKTYHMFLITKSVPVFGCLGAALVHLGIFSERSTAGPGV